MKIDQQLAEALRAVRRENTMRIHRIRTVGSGAFLVVALLLVNVFDQGEAWEHRLPAVAIYFATALVLLLAATSIQRIRRLSRFAVPVLDIPMVFAIQAQALLLPGCENPAQVAEFSLAIFVCLVLLSAFTLDLRQICVALVMSAVAHQVLQSIAGSGLPARISSLVIFGLVAWICIFAGRNRIELVTRVTRSNARRARLQRYFSPGVAKLLEGHDEEVLSQGTECELTVVFTDIRGFTKLSERMPGQEVVCLLNLYHNRMVDAVFSHGGTLDKYLGDGLMIYFNAPIGQPDHARRAVMCALEMVERLNALNTERSWKGIQELRMGVGIHTGRAILGDIGAPHRREFTAIGDAVNVAARLEQLTKELPHDVLVSGTTTDLVRDDFMWSKVGRVPVRGREEPVDLFVPGAPSKNPG